MKLRGLSSLVLLLAVGCGGSAADSESSGTSSPDTGVADSISEPGPQPTGVPCDVADVLAARCTKCHGAPLKEGAPYPLLSYDDLARPAPKDSKQTVAQRCVARMNDASNSMPPLPDAPATSAEIGKLQAWIDGGMPKGTCGSTSDAGITDTGPSPYDTPVKCSSGLTWFLGDLGSSKMHPGKACISCHTTKADAPALTVAGTVYPSAHEPDDCVSRVSGATVVLTGADGATVTLSVDSFSGNFSYQGPLARPYKAKVVASGKERVMSKAQTNGDCNSCHTQSGTEDAPGRILMP